MEKLLTFIFPHKNTSAVITISAIDFDDAHEQLEDIVKDVNEFRCENYEGTSEDYE